MCVLTRNPCDISVLPGGGTEIRDSREALKGRKDWYSSSGKNDNLSGIRMSFLQSLDESLRLGGTDEGGNLLFGGFADALHTF